MKIIKLILGISVLLACTGNVDIAKKVARESIKYDSRVTIFNVKSEGDKSSLVISGETSDKKLAAKLRSQLKEMGYNVLDSLTYLPTSAHKPNALVRLSVVNMRQRSSVAAEMASQSLMGTVLQVMKQKGSWSYVQTPDGYLGWVNNHGLTFISEKDAQEYIDSEKIIFTGRVGFVYKTPELTEIITDIVEGNILRKLKVHKKYTEVELTNGMNGFVRNCEYMDYSEWLTQEPTIENIVKQSGSYLGIQYLWGGASVKGLDCSGFVKNLYYMNGVLLPRDASQQALTGKILNVAEGIKTYQPGDLLFFGRMRNNKKRITHVGMYIGDTEYIHCAGSVKINSLDSTRENYNNYRGATLLAASRIVGFYDDYSKLLKDCKVYNNTKKQN